MGQESTAGEVQMQMSRIRGRLDAEVRSVVEGARQLTDWRHYVRVFPLGSIAAASLVGFLAVPRKTKVVTTDLDSLKKLARDKQIIVEYGAKSGSRSGWPASIAMLVTNALLRAGFAYVGQRLGQFSAEKPTDHPLHEVATK